MTRVIAHSQCYIIYVKLLFSKPEQEILLLCLLLEVAECATLIKDYVVSAVALW